MGINQIKNNEHNIVFPHIYERNILNYLLSWWDLVWIGTSSSEFTIVQVLVHASVENQFILLQLVLQHECWKHVGTGNHILLTL